MQGKYNAGTTTTDKNMWLTNRFHMWMVCNGIANLLSLPRLEAKGWRVTYDALMGWFIYSPNERKFILKRHTSLCCGFPYFGLPELKKDKEVVALVNNTQDSPS